VRLQEFLKYRAGRFKDGVGAMASLPSDARIGSLTGLRDEERDKSSGRIEAISSLACRQLKRVFRLYRRYKKGTFLSTFRKIIFVILFYDSS
jgi:hypothetical protein